MRPRREGLDLRQGQFSSPVISFLHHLRRVGGVEVDTQDRTIRRANQMAVLAPQRADTKSRVREGFHE